MNFDSNTSSPYAFATMFPEPILTSSSFNRSLFAAIGHATGREARAFANGQHAGLSFWTPNVNIFRDPRWGRGQETPGEDPYLNSEYASLYVQALQNDSEDETRLLTSACLKHFMACECSSGCNRPLMASLMIDDLP